MSAYVYRWSLRPEAGLDLELSVQAPNAAAARRELERFLIAHRGGSWVVESVTREIAVRGISRGPLAR